MTKPFKKIQKILTAVLLTVAVGVAAIGLLATVGHNGSIKVLVVLTGSMEPTIPVGSLVLTRPASDYQVDDVITYRQSGNFITHRVVAKVNGAYQTKGDANNGPDGDLILSSMIAGKVFISLPYVGRFIQFVKTPLGFSLLIILPATLVVIQEIFSIGRELARREAQKLKLAMTPTMIDVRPSGSRSAAKTGKKTMAAKRRRTSGRAEAVKIKRGSVSTRRTKKQKSEPSPLGWSTPVRTRVVQASMMLLLTVGSLLGGTKAYFSNIGLSNNNIYNSGQYIASTLVINELVYNSSCTPNPDTKIVIELWNGSAGTINIKDWKLRDQLGNIVSISNANFDLAAGQFVLLSKSSNTFNANCYGAPPAGVSSLNLGGTIIINTTSGFLELLDTASVVVDTVAYGSPNPSAAVDKSIERRQLGFDTALGNGFTAGDFMAQFPATLGFALPTPQTVVINEFMVAPDSGAIQEFIELRNNSVASVNISSWQLFSGNGTVLEATIPAATTLTPGQRWLHQFTANTPPASGDEIANTENKLFLKDAGSVIRDAFSYHKFAPTSGTSWSRIPEGTNTWVLDATQTPGTVNAL